MNVLNHNEFQLSLPAGWEDNSHVIARGPPQPDFVASLVMVTEPLPPGDTLEQVAGRHVKALEAIPAFNLIKQEPKKLGAHQGVFREYTFEGPNTAKLTQLQFSIAVGRKVCTLTYSDTQERMPKTRQLGLDLIASLKLQLTAGEGFDRKEKLMELSPTQQPAQSSPESAARETISMPRGPVKG